MSKEFFPKCTKTQNVVSTCEKDWNPKMENEMCIFFFFWHLRKNVIIIEKKRNQNFFLFTTEKGIRDEFRKHVGHVVADSK